MSDEARRRELEALREDGLSPARRGEFRASARAIAAWERRHPRSLEDALAWVEALRSVFGDPPVDRSVRPGNDYRL